MTSARTCYCKQEGCVLREKDNDIGTRSENRRPATVASRKSIVKSRSSERSLGTARSVVDEKKPDTSRSIETRARDSVLSPETSTALENAERIINDAKIQLAEIRVVSGFDSARPDKDTYADDLPLDDEVEELLYIRELVTSKFQETSHLGRPEAGGEENAPRITTRRVDLSAPKFQTSQRRRAAVRTSLEYGMDEQRSRGRASFAGASKDSEDSSPKDSSSKDDEVTARDSQTARNRRRVSSAARFGLVHPDDSDVCRIQIGPPVHVNGELTRQDLEDVHISPTPSLVRVNAATYILRHESVAEESSVDNEANELVMTSRARRRARLATSSKEKREKLIAVEVVEETATIGASRKLEEDIRVVIENKNTDYEGENEQNEPTTSQFQVGAYGGERRDEEVDSRNAKDAKILESPMVSAMNEEATNIVGRSESVDVRQVEINGNNVESLHMGDRGIFNKKNGVDSPGRQQNEEHVAHKIQVKNRGDQSQPPLADVSRRASFPERENIPQPCRTTTSLKQYRTIDEYLSNTFNSHDEPDKSYDVVAEEIRRSHLSWDDFPAKNDAIEVELYRPQLDELDSTLLSNDKKIQRVIRAAQTFAELLSKPEFAKYKFEERKRETSRAKSSADLSGDHGRRNPLVLDKPTTSSSVIAITSKNQVSNVSSASEMRRVSDADSQETSATATEAKSLSFTRRNVRRRDDHSYNFMESTERLTSDASDGSKISPDEDDVQQLKPKARLSESSMDKSDITTFSNLPPALSSTRTDTQTHRSRQEHSRIAQAKPEASKDRYAKPHATNRFEDSANKTDRRMKEEHNIDVFAQILQGLRNETTDRFVAYVLQDERRSVEEKIVKALNESAIAPTMMEKLLARLQKADSVSDGATRRTETLDVLRDILINVKNRTDGVADDKTTKEEKEIEKIDSRNISPRAIEESIPYEENGRQTRTRVASNENGRLVEDSRDLRSRDECSGTRRSATHTISDSRSNSERKRDLCSESKSSKISDILSNEIGNSKEHSRFSPAKTASMRSQKEMEIPSHKMKADAPDATITTFQDEEGNMSDEERKYKPEIKDDEDPVLGDRHANESIPRTITDQVNDALLDVPSGTLVVVKEQEEVSEITAEKIASDNTASKDKNASSPVSGASRKKDKRTQSDANSDRSRIVDEILAKKNLPRSLIEENVRSSCAQAEKDVNNPRADSAVATNGRISPANSCSADSLRDCASLRTLSSVQSDESPLKEVQSRGKRSSIVCENNSTKTNNEGDHSRGEPMTNGAPKNRENGNEESALPKSAGSDRNEQFRPVASTSRRSLSSSNSSVNSTMLDHNSESNNDVLGDNIKRTETSSEMSYSEGELYMPSSCSYSLGEVRILEKGDLIANSTIERDSSMTILVTRSMLTSLNDSSTALGSSGRV